LNFHKEKEMVAFRKLIPVLAFFALLLSASSAFAQSANMQCAVTAGVPPVVRQEGFTELVGDILITCTGGTQQAPFLANFTVFLNTNITSRLVTADLSEALLIIDEAGAPSNPAFCVSPGVSANGNGVAPFIGGVAPTCNSGAQVAGGPQAGTYNVFHASRTQDISGAARENSLTWGNIPIVPPGTTGTRTFRVTNIRANATAITSGGFGLPGQIVAFVSAFPPGALPLNNPQQLIGYVQPGMAFDLRNCQNSDSSSTNIEQCGTGSTSAGRDLFANPQADKSLGALASFRFREGFQSAFKPRVAPGQSTTGMLPGTTFNAESGFMHTGTLGTNTGLADSGTRLAVRFTNVPSNTIVFVSTRNIAVGPARARLVTTDINGAGGGSPAFDPTGGGLPSGYVGPRLNCAAAGSTVAGDWPAIAIQTPGGSGLAVWEIVEDATTPGLAGIIEEMIFYYGVAYQFSTQAGQPPTLALATANVVGNFAPFYAAANTMSSVLPIPRFINNPQTPLQLFRITACQTNLLFPYITNAAGFDTGLAFANTSEDIFSDPQNRRQQGTCRISYFGSLAADPATLVTRTETTTKDVRAGEVLTYILSSGSTYWGLQGYPNFTGYAIAQCGFRFGHGFAFVTDGPIGSARVAEGYLALVLDGGDDNVRARGQSTGEVRGQ
jgi:hypothetical protein